MSPQHRFGAMARMTGRLYIQQDNRGSPYWGLPDEHNTFPPEMLLPVILAGMVQRHLVAALRVERGLTRSLAKRTRNAGQC